MWRLPGTHLSNLNKTCDMNHEILMAPGGKPYLMVYKYNYFCCYTVGGIIIFVGGNHKTFVGGIAIFVGKP